jgi:hypothetical protein
MENEALHGKRLSCGVVGDILYTLHCIVFNKHNLLPVEKLVSALTFTVSNRGIFALICCISLPFILVGSIVMATRNEFSYGCTGCEMTFTEIAEIVIVSLVFLAFCFIFTVRTWRLPDPWRFRQEILLVLLCGVITLLGFVVDTFTPMPADGSFFVQIFSLEKSFTELSLKIDFYLSQVLLSREFFPYKIYNSILVLLYKTIQSIIIFNKNSSTP